MFNGIEYRLQQHIQVTDNKSVVISDSSVYLLHIERIPEARSITNMANTKHYNEKGHSMFVCVECGSLISNILLCDIELLKLES